MAIPTLSEVRPITVSLACAGPKRWFCTWPRKASAATRLEAVVSYGETQPLIVTQGRERRNRRTVTEVSGFVQGHPNLLNGRYAEVIFREYVTSGEPASTLSGGGGGGTIADAMGGG